MKLNAASPEKIERRGRQRYRLSWIFGVLTLVLLGYLIFEIVSLIL